MAALSCPLPFYDHGNSSSVSSMGVPALSASAALSNSSVPLDPSLPERFSTLYSENRELIRLLDRTHAKLKAAKAQVAQAEAQLHALFQVR